MSLELFTWLQEEWKYCNLPKYQKYFTTWVDNLTSEQIQGFKKQMNQNLNK